MDIDELANELYIQAINPDLTWWDDLPPEWQEGWRRAARWVDREFIRREECHRLVVEAVRATTGGDAA